MSSFNLETYEPKGKLVGVPKHIIKRMLECQVEQGNEENVEVFERFSDSNKLGGGFDWGDTKEGYSIWYDVIWERDYDLFPEPGGTKSFAELNDLVIQWAAEKGILEKATPLAQIQKTEEEVMETKMAIIAQRDGKETFENLKGKVCNTKEEIKDGFGDQLVTILVGCKLQNIDPLDALESAYNVISKRTGKMVDGKFVKSSDL